MSGSRKILGVIALVASWTLVAGAPASAADCGPVNTQVIGLSQGQMESSIGCLINDERTSYGLQPVAPNGDLRRAALSHSDEMINQGYFEHTSPAGLTFIDRIQATGYMRGTRSWEVGENLVWGTGPLSTPQSLVTSWMNSPPHRENLLTADLPGDRDRGRRRDTGEQRRPDRSHRLERVRLPQLRQDQEGQGEKGQGEEEQGEERPRQAPGPALATPSPAGLYRERSASGNP